VRRLFCAQVFIDTLFAESRLTEALTHPLAESEIRNPKFEIRNQNTSSLGLADDGGIGDFGVVGQEKRFAQNDG
jgi:hypothetical protein